MVLHLTPLMKRERTLLLQEAWRKSHLSNVMDEAAQVGELLILQRKTEMLGDVTGINGDRSRVTRGVLVSGIERCHKRGGERQVRALQTSICLSERTRRVALFLIELKETLQRDRRNEEGRRNPE